MISRPRVVGNTRDNIGDGLGVKEESSGVRHCTALEMIVVVREQTTFQIS